MSKKRKKSPPSDPSIPADKLLAQYGVPANWDLLLVGDGSGSTAEKCAGYGVTVVYRDGNFRRTLLGGFSCISIPVAELFPYIHALWFFHDAMGKDIIRRRGRAISTVILCDNEMIVHQGMGLSQRKHMAPWWEAYSSIERMGYITKWIHVYRSTVALNEMADFMSVRSRVSIEALDKEFNTPLVYEVNPLTHNPKSRWS